MMKKVLMLMMFLILLMSVIPVHASMITVDGTDAIFLAGRTDITIPPLGGTDPSFPLKRHTFIRKDFLQETFPQSTAADEGMIFSFDASGSIHYYNGTGTGFGPDGGAASGSSLSGLGGISGYQGPQGALVGLFLDDTVPLTGPGPAIIDFRTTGIGTSFLELSPELGQIFFIGDGLTGAGAGGQQTFIAPESATRLFLGIPDGWGFMGEPGYYEDNDGSFQVDVNAVPIPGAIWLLGSALIGLAGFRKEIKNKG